MLATTFFKLKSSIRTKFVFFRSRVLTEDLGKVYETEH